MRRLPDNFQRNGFSFRKIRRIGRVCLYEQNYEQVRYYLVFVVQIKPSKVFKDKQIPDYERLPSGESYGHSAWVGMDLKAAVLKFDSLVVGEQKVALVQRTHK